MIFTRAVCRHLFTQKQPIYCRRLFASEVDGAGTSTGIEHALKFKQVGMTNKRDFDKEYKCAEYLHMNKYSYYDVEVHRKWTKLIYLQNS